MCDFCLPAGSNLGRAAPKVEQKTGEMSLFCLPAGPNSGRAAPKVEQNLKNFEKCSTAASKFGSRGLESRTKSSKIEKMFYR